MSQGTRIFVSPDDSSVPVSSLSSSSPSHHISSIRNATLGDSQLFPTPLGYRRITYLDHTATGRASSLVEASVSRLVLPTLANTHTSTSYTGWCSHSFLEEARGIVRDSVAGASDALHAVILSGRGSTGVSNALLHMLRPQQQQPQHSCAFPGCGRLYPSALELLTHARTHPDGDGVAWRDHAAAAAADAAAGAAAAAASSSSSSSSALPALPTVHAVVGPYAHHSSFLPWHAAGAVMSHVSSCCPAAPGTASNTPATPAQLLQALAASLAAAAAARPALLVALLTVASNVTGAALPQDAATALVHAFGGIAIWDAAAAAPHGVGLCMVEGQPGQQWDAPALVAAAGGCAALASALAAASSPPQQRWSPAKDALYFSPHKLPGGGAGCMGVLLLRKALIASASPSSPGGGTVFFVSPAGTPRYLGNDSEREEAGSPDVAAAARTGLCLLLARSVGWGEIRGREAAMAEAALAAWAASPRIIVLGRGSAAAAGAAAAGAGTATAPGPASSVPILSLAIASRHGGLLHWALLCAMLTDVFGIQARGGCLCAGPYASELLGLTPSDSAALEERLLVARDELLRPGFLRLSFLYTTSHAAFRYAVQAVLWLAEHADALAPLYTALPDTGEWRVHRAGLRGALEEGYKGWEAGGGSRQQQLQLPSAVIEGLREGGGEAAGEAALEAARRGGSRPHTRIWLQSVRFGEGEAAMLPPAPPSVKWGAQGPSRAVEAALYAAYLQEAQLLVTGLQAQAQALAARGGKGGSSGSEAGGAAAAAAAAAGGPGSSTLHLLSPAGEALRWFALPGAPAPPFDMASRLHGVSAADAAAVAAAASGHSAYTATLMQEEPSRQELELWDGPEPAGSSSGSGEVAAAAAGAATAVIAAPAAAAATGAAPLKKATRTRLEGGALRASGGSGGGGGGGGFKTQWVSSLAATPTPTPSSAAAATAATAATDPAAPPPLGPITPSQYATRKARLAVTQAALARMLGSPGPSPALQRALSSGISEAVIQYRMISAGDRVLVGLSGGKDSMTLLLQLLRLQAVAPVWFEVGACTVDPQYEGFDPSPLKAWCAELGVPYFFEAVPIMALAQEHMDKDSICAFCSRLKRGILYSACRREGYNVLALGQHLDDLAESFVMSAFRNGLLRTMKAHYLNDDGDVRIIRPLALVREQATRAYAHAATLPIIPENCPACFSGPTVRYAVKRLLAKEEGENANLFQVLGRAMRPLMSCAGHDAVAAAAEGGVGEEVLRAAPAGFVPAKLEEAQGGGVGGEGEEQEREREEEVGGGGGLPWNSAGDEDF